MKVLFYPIWVLLSVACVGSKGVYRKTLLECSSSVLDSEINVPKGRTVVGLVHSMWRVVILIYVLQLYFGKEVSISLCFLF